MSKHKQMRPFTTPAKCFFEVLIYQCFSNYACIILRIFKRAINNPFQILFTIKSNFFNMKNYFSFRNFYGFVLKLFAYQTVNELSIPFPIELDRFLKESKCMQYLYKIYLQPFYHMPDVVFEFPDVSCKILLKLRRREEVIYGLATQSNIFKRCLVY